MQKGEIWMVALPDLGGHEQAGLRPAVILSDSGLPVVIVIPCTSNMQALRFPLTMLIEPSNNNGLEEKSVALVFHVRAIDRRRLIKKIGHLNKSEMIALDLVIKNMLSL